MDKLNIGIFGGSFDPVTTGHVRVATAALNHTDPDTYDAILDEVWFMPCAGHTFNKSLQSEDVRLDMLRIQIQSSGSFRICDYELKNHSTGSTYDTLKTFKEKFFGLPLDFYYIIGSDNTQSMEKWVNWEKLIEEFRFMIMPRPGYPVADWARQKPHEVLNVGFGIEMGHDISSSAVRNFIAEGKHEEARRLVAPRVADYIEKHKLYQGVTSER